MSDNEDEAYKRGVRDNEIKSLGKRMTRLEIIAGAIGAAIATSWAKFTGFLP